MSRATQVRSTLAMPKNSRSSSVGSTVLVNLDVYIIRATIGRDISPDDDDLIVLFRRNSKEVTSEPTRWHPDHIAEWNQHVGIQTSLLRNKQSQLPSDVVDYLPKDYEVVLVALPSHSAVALFSLDFAQIVQTQRANRPKPFRVSPSKCRDLAATLEFEVVWEFASPPPPLTPTHSPSLTTNASTSSLSMAGRRTNVSVVSMSSQNSELTSNGGGGGGVGASKEDCSDCRSLRRRLERKEMQILQLENFLKESQKRIDSLVFENEELVVREQAETTNAAQYRALNMRLLQELEMAFQFCAQQMIQAQQTQSDMPPQMFMFLPQFEFMERVKKFHADLELIYAGSAATLDLHDSSVGGAGGGAGAPGGSKVPQTPMDAWSAFDFKEEMDVALDRNQRLQRQLEFLARSLVFEDGGGGGGGGGGGPLELRRKATNTSSASDFSIASPTGGAHDDDGELSSSRAAPVRSITEQLNALERENFLLKAKLESAMNDLKSARHDGGGRGGSSPSECAETATTASSTSRQSDITATLSLLPVVPDDSPLRMEVDQLREEKLDLIQELETLRAELETARMTPPPALPIGVGVVATQGSNSVHSVHSGGAGGLGNSRVSMASVGSPPPPGGSDFLNKIYMDVGKAKVALEEKVKRLNLQLTSMQEENERLQTQIMITAGGGGGGGGGMEDSAHWESQIEELKTTFASDRAAMEEERRQLEEQIHHLQQLIDEKTSQLKVQDQELQFMKQHLTEKAALVTELESAKTQIQTQLNTTTQLLSAAQKSVTALEIKLETLAHDQLQQAAKDQELQQQAMATTTTTTTTIKQSKRDDDELSDLTKQLKLARQEVMQLRYRSNNLESVHEKLEDALKEKKTLQVKLTALEGQLYEQRSRTTSGMNFASDGKDMALMEELQRMLDVKTTQLTATQREVDTLRRELESGALLQATVSASAKSGADFSELEAKVAQSVAEITRLGERNDDQALRINALSERVEKTTREKYELEGIMKELLKEMDELAALSPARSHAASPARSHAASAFSTPNVSSHESEDGFVEEQEEEEEEAKEEEDKHTRLLPAPPSVVVRPTGNKVVERYANALKSTFERRGSAGRPPAPSPSHASGSASGFASGPPARVTTSGSKIAHLIKNFSSDETTTTSTMGTTEDDDDNSTASAMVNGRRRSTLGGGSIKKVTRMDFANRQRQGSEPSSS